MGKYDSLSTLDFEKLCTFLKESSGICLGKDKKYLALKRLEKLMKKESASLGELINRAKEKRGSGLHEKIIDAMTTRETLWFRDAAPFEILKNHILPEKTASGSKPVRVWSAACSSGQEPYSIGMVIKEILPKLRGYSIKDFEILATDISPSALSDATEGIYDKLALSRGLSEDRKIKFFTPKGTKWQIKDEVRKMVAFKEFNLQKSFAGLGKFDVIYCRNVLIYFSDDFKREILNRMARILNPEGYLFVGGSELIMKYSNFFKRVTTCSGIVGQLIKKPVHPYLS